MNLKSFIGAICTCLSIMSSNVYAAIIDYGTYVTDTASGLDWLDVSTTRGDSYNAVLGRISVGGNLEGWRLATSTELTTLFINWGLVSETPANMSNGAPLWQAGDINSDLIDDVISILGDTNALYNADTGSPHTYNELGEAGYTEGMIFDDFDPTKTYAAIINDSDFSIDGNQFINPDIIGSRSGIYNKNTSYGFMGSYLVQASVVPIPATVWLFGSGLLGLVGLARRKKI